MEDDWRIFFDYVMVYFPVMSDYKVSINSKADFDKFISDISDNEYSWITISIAKNIITARIKLTLAHHGMIFKKTYCSITHFTYCHKSISEYIPKLEEGKQTRSAVLVMHNDKIIVDKRYIGTDGSIRSHTGYANGRRDVTRASKYIITRDLGVDCIIRPLELLGYGTVRHPFANRKIASTWIYVVAVINDSAYEKIKDTTESYDILGFNDKCIDMLKHPGLENSLISMLPKLDE
jgi:hypothetical protein